jgi:hypothetical protein
VPLPTVEAIEEIERLHAEASPGPFTYDACSPVHRGEGFSCERVRRPGPDDVLEPADWALLVVLRNAAPALLESARLARVAAELFREHGEAMANSLAARAREARDMHGAFTRAAELDRAHTALESTIAAFRKGAE